MAKAKTWSELIGDLDETARKWERLVRGSLEIDSSLPPRSREKRYHDVFEREVRLRFRWYDPGTGRDREIRADVRAADRAEGNLRLVAVALEMLRLAEVRGVHRLLALCYRQMYPPPEAPAPRQIPEHYAALFLSPGAPLAVAEAAYRTLAKAAHPDAGGSAETMARLNLAIERIRKDKQ